MPPVSEVPPRLYRLRTALKTTYFLLASIALLGVVAASPIVWLCHNPDLHILFTHVHSSVCPSSTPAFLLPVCRSHDFPQDLPIKAACKVEEDGADNRNADQSSAESMSEGREDSLVSSERSGKAIFEEKFKDKTIQPSTRPSRSLAKASSRLFWRITRTIPSKSTDASMMVLKAEVKRASGEECGRNCNVLGFRGAKSQYNSAAPRRHGGNPLRYPVLLFSHMATLGVRAKHPGNITVGAANDDPEAEPASPDEAGRRNERRKIGAKSTASSSDHGNHVVQRLASLWTSVFYPISNTHPTNPDTDTDTASKPNLIQDLLGIRFRTAARAKPAPSAMTPSATGSCGTNVTDKAEDPNAKHSHSRPARGAGSALYRFGCLLSDGLHGWTACGE